MKKAGYLSVKYSIINPILILFFPFKIHSKSIQLLKSGAKRLASFHPNVVAGIMGKDLFTPKKKKHTKCKNIIVKRTQITKT